jgi:hypothetical protein
LAFEFNKPSSTNPPEYNGIDKPKEVIKKNKPLNKNTEILEFLFNQKDNNNNNTKLKTSNNIEDIFDPKNMEYTTSLIPLLQILVLDSQVIIPSSTPSSNSSSYIVSPTLQLYIVQW